MLHFEKKNMTIEREEEALLRMFGGLITYYRRLRGIAYTTNKTPTKYHTKEVEKEKKQMSLYLQTQIEKANGRKKGRSC
jgi:hypothetical protein